MNVVVEKLKQRIVATSVTLKISEARTEQYIQNRKFQTNQTRFFQMLEKEDRSNNVRPGSEFWSGIWDQPVTRNNNAQ